MAVLCTRRATAAAAAALLCAGTAVAQYDFGGMGGDYPDMDDYGMDEYGMGGGGGASDSPDAHIRGVLDLDDVTFDKVITGEAAAFVEFYAPWCGHCKSLKPEFEALAAEMGSHPALVLAKVDVDSEGGRSLGERFGVEGFPTLKFLPPGGGDADDYDGDRTASAMQDFLESKVGPAGALPEMAEAVETFAKDMASGISAAEKVAATLAEGDEEKAEKAAVYVKVMNSIKAKGKEYISKEIERLGRMIDSGSVTEDKAASFKVKRSTLRVFSAKDEL